jgi:hypothetical protein
MGNLGQSSDPEKPAFHALGIPLVDGLVEIVTPETSGAGGRHEGLVPDTIAIRAWMGEPADPENDIGGVGWIQADRWRPYQRSTFVTPAFAGYVSGHSVFSRTAAEILTLFTGSPYFPGGLGTHTVPAGGLEFEAGPSTDIELQWASYFDAADQAGISRLFGGIHVPADDGPGRVIGSEVGKTAFAKAVGFISGDLLRNFSGTITMEEGTPKITWPCLPGFRYKVQASATLASDGFSDLTDFQAFEGDLGEYVDAGIDGPARQFYRVVRALP